MKWYSDIEPKPFEDWQYMACPECGEKTVPYGGFGEYPPEWQSVGKYSCRRHREVVWYANPVTGQHYDRDSRGRLVKVKLAARLTDFVIDEAS